MTFEELQQMAASPVAAPAAEAASPWDEPAVPAAEDVVPTEAPSPFAEPLATHDESPFAAEPEPLAAVPAAEPLAEEPPVWSPGGVHSEPAVETAVAAAADMSALPDHLTRKKGEE